MSRIQMPADMSALSDLWIEKEITNLCIARSVYEGLASSRIPSTKADAEVNLAAIAKALLALEQEQQLRQARHLLESRSQSVNRGIRVPAAVRSRVQSPAVHRSGLLPPVEAGPTAVLFHRPAPVAP